MQVFSVILGLIGTIFTILPFIKTKAWYIRIFDFPRMQVATMCLIAIILMFIYTPFLTLPYILTIVLAGTALAYQFTLILRFTPFYHVQTKRSRKKDGDRVISILQSNVKMDNRNTIKFKKMVFKYKPDILSVNEPNQWWADELKELDQLYPYSIQKPLENTYGMMLFSKHPLKNTEINFIMNEEIPSFFTTVTLPGSAEFDLHCLHPEPPSPGSSTYERDTELLIIGKRIKETPRPAVVVGDLNDVAWSHTTRRFKKIAEVLDPRQGRGLFNSYNVFVPLFRYPLDHFFHTRHFTYISMKKLRAFGSDHFPMLIKLHLEETESEVQHSAQKA